MTEHSIFQRLLQAKSALKSTILKILDLNQKLKREKESRKALEALELRQELKLLNKVADQQAKIVKLYEIDLRKKVSN